MHTNLADFIRHTPEGREADAILRKCTHCGLCTATCPTYQLLGDELDGPRGRIYLMKQVLEGAEPTGRTQLHLDRCLTCRSCETTCPSGVRYGRLLDIGRHLVDERVSRGPIERVKHRALRAVIPQPALFRPLLKLGQFTRPLLPPALKRKVPAALSPPKPWPRREHPRRMLVLEGCVQPSLSPATNAAAARVLDRLEISLVSAPGAGCCGAISFHLNAREEALDFMRRNIDAWWPYIEQGAEAIVITASGCGAMVKEYGHLLARHSAYAEKAKRVSELTKDISEIVAAEKGRLLAVTSHESRVTSRPKIAFHAPCTLQHGLKMTGKVEALLADIGFELTEVPDAHLCCGSAGTYSLLQPELSQQLLANKIAALTRESPAAILTANIGCQAHLQSATALPVRHWIEALDDSLPSLSQLG
ncbi:MAG: glycolate oxidase subunit GlcF [Betaproteobacteria bacterium]|nr:glycolate oxidase subunit GlcF [Betaproteobacteria bacterium]